MACRDPGRPRPASRAWGCTPGHRRVSFCGDRRARDARGSRRRGPHRPARGRVDRAGDDRRGPRRRAPRRPPWSTRSPLSRGSECTRGSRSPSTGPRCRSSTGPARHGATRSTGSGWRPGGPAFASRVTAAVEVGTSRYEFTARPPGRGRGAPRARRIRRVAGHPRGSLATGKPSISASASRAARTFVARARHRRARGGRARAPRQSRVGRRPGAGRHPSRGTPVFAGRARAPQAAGSGGGPVRVRRPAARPPSRREAGPRRERPRGQRERAQRASSWPTDVRSEGGAFGCPRDRHRRHARRRGPPGARARRPTTCSTTRTTSPRRRARRRCRS